MSIKIVNMDDTEKQIFSNLQKLPLATKKKIAKQINEMLEKLEDMQDLKDARARMKEKSIPYDDAIKKIGLK